MVNEIIMVRRLKTICTSPLVRGCNRNEFFSGDNFCLILYDLYVYDMSDGVGTIVL